LCAKPHNIAAPAGMLGAANSFELTVTAEVLEFGLT
jgi:ACR3 family arsenite efflux pump ArsB